MSNKYEIRPYASDSDDSGDEGADFDVDKLEPLEVGPGEHKLQYTYCLWFGKKGSHRAAVVHEYVKSLHFVGRCASVEQWWSLYCHLVKPTVLKPFRRLHLFKSGIKPMWEDPANMRGGKWVIRLKKSKIDRAWENVCMAMLGEQFLVGTEICGVVLCTQVSEDVLSVWNRTATDTDNTIRIRETLRRVLNLPQTHPIEYKPHCDSLKFL
ncbi:eukaryotic translation initiation factor 4E type 2 isoform X1 [Anopheles ziemanni]|nr:eukaryotic translation initiation factor 4E type 2 isoform X1 [Anopheles coustani]XP_058171776.1 eukaryotic translation initiation factor 4E type 2 isoform X1 [Anopheles ziemanni]